MGAIRVARVSLTTADPDRLERFYRSAFGFERIGLEAHHDAPFARLAGVARAEARSTVLALGRQVLELAAFDEPGRPYPPGVASNDARFQHFAIVVASMESAYARLREIAGWAPITGPAPQRLPASSGGVTAFKFRDPEGHPLELLEFAPTAAPAAWRAVGQAGQVGLSPRPVAPDRPAADPSQPAAFCLGIDHSAIVVADTARSIEFYVRLGFSVRGRSLNRGLEQQQLDGVPDPTVEVTALASDTDPPHLELLCYRSPATRAAGAPAAWNDALATRLVLELEAEPLASLESRLAAAGVRLEWGASPLDGATAALRDPDGHALLLRYTCSRSAGRATSL
ncbi:MAG: VOC family protein [Steroidobacteraceae bacterium]